MHISKIITLEHDLLERFRNLDLQFTWTRVRILISNLSTTCDLREKLPQIHMFVNELKSRVEIPCFTQYMDEALLINQSICILNDLELRRIILEGEYNNKFTINLGSSKLYQDLKKNYWWPDIKEDIVGYVTWCLICQQVKIEH